jgi:hypothetical protein
LNYTDINNLDNKINIEDNKENSIDVNKNFDDNYKEKGIEMKKKYKVLDDNTLKRKNFKREELLRIKLPKIPGNELKII